MGSGKFNDGGDPVMGGVCVCGGGGGGRNLLIHFMIKKYK